MIQDAIEKHIDDFFGKKSLPVNIMPVSVLSEIFFHELDNAVFRGQTKNISDDMQGQPFLAGWEKDTVSLSEYEQLLQTGLINDRAMICAKELKRRGHSEFKRAFEDNPNHIIDISLPEDGGKGRSIRFNPAYDREKLDYRNMKRFLDGVVSLYNEGKKLLGSVSESAMKLTGRYTYWISDDFTQGVYTATESSEFCFEWNLVAKDEFAAMEQMNREEVLKTPVDSKGWNRLSPTCYSWDKLWRAMFKSMALRTIEKDKSVQKLFNSI